MTLPLLARLVDCLRAANLYRDDSRVATSESASCVPVELHNMLRGLSTPMSIVLLSSQHEAYGRALESLLVQELGLSDRSLVIVLVQDSRPRKHEGGFWIVENVDVILSGLRRDGPRFLRDLAISRFPLTRLNPYQSSRPVSELMFFGRQTDIVDLCSDQENYIIVGPRRGGKTSLALQVKRHLRTDPSFRVSVGRGLGGSTTRYLFSVSYIDIQKLVKLEDIWAGILKDMGLEERDLRGGIRKKLKLKRTVEEKFDFELLYDLLRFKYKHCVLLLDEVDYWLGVDERHGWPIFGKLRALADDTEARTKVVMLGYDGLLMASKDHKFPFYGRTRVRRIANLERDAVMALVEAPLSEVGVKFYDLPQIVPLIDRATGGMPNLVQDVCRAILVRISGDTERAVTPRLVSELLDKTREEIIRSVYEAFNELDSSVARLVAYLAAGTGEVRIFEMLDRLRRELHVDVSDSEARDVFDYLYLHNVLRRIDQNSYSFASEMLEERLREDLIQPDANVFLKALGEQARRERGAL